jgi:MFS family permease
MAELHRPWRALALSLLCVLFIIAPHLKGSLILEDPFHEGEFFATAVSYFGTTAPPFRALSIHGVVDVLPAWLARLIWGDDHYLLPTVALYAVLNILAAALLLLIADELSRQRPWRGTLLLVTALAAGFFVGYRDLILLAALYVFVLLHERPWRVPTATVLRLLLGALLGFGLFWSFDRGIAGAFAFGPPLLILAIKRRSEWWVALGAALTVLGLGLVSGPFSLPGYLDNLRVLLATSAQWGYGWRGEALILSLFAAAIGLFVMALGLRSAWRERRSLERLTLRCVLLLLTVIMLKIGLNRADVEHIYSALWAPLCLLLSLPRKDLQLGRAVLLLPILIGVGAALTVLQHNLGIFLIACLTAYACTPHQDTRDLRLSHLTLLALLTLSASALLYSHGKHLREGQYQWLTHLNTLPSNSATLTPGAGWAAARLQERQVGCVFDLANNGVINALLDRPACTRFTYPVYANADYEAELIQALNTTAPSAIVYSTTFPSYRIDGRDMRQRFPQLDAFVLERYPQQVCGLGYCVRYRQVE